MKRTSHPEWLAIRHAPPSLELGSKPDSVDVYIVWHGAPKYFSECIEKVARSCDFYVKAITAEERVVYRDESGAMCARSLRRVRLCFTGPREVFSSGLLAVLEEIDRVCPWVHVARRERSMAERGPSLPDTQALRAARLQASCSTSPFFTLEFSI